MEDDKQKVQAGFSNVERKSNLFNRSKTGGDFLMEARGGEANTPVDRSSKLLLNMEKGAEQAPSPRGQQNDGRDASMSNISNSNNDIKNSVSVPVNKKMPVQ